MADLPPAGSAAATLSCGAVLLAPMAISHWPAQALSAPAWASAAALGVVCTGGLPDVLPADPARRYGPGFHHHLPIPVFGALLAWAILGEPLTWTMLLAGALILGSVAFSRKVR
jgi:drug/metabolite transporter (DMT)-like permease